jgi:transposase
MTTTDIAVIDPDEAEVVEWQPLNKTEAKRLDKKIRATSDKVISNNEKTLALFDELKELLTQAKDGEIHKALGLKSWTAYLADAVNVTVPQREDRKVLVAFLSGQGMSQRAIAGTLGVSQKTVDRDLDGEDVDEGATVTSLDGAQRPKNGSKPEVIDAEVVDVENDSDTPMTAAEIVTAFDDETANLWAAFSELAELTHEDKFSGARKRIANANMDSLGEVAKGLQQIIDDLMTV